MKRLLLSACFIVMMVANADALVWKIYATSNVANFSDFSLLIDDADGDNVVYLADVSYFSGVTQYNTSAGTSLFLSELTRIADITINSLNLENPQAVDWWGFWDPVSRTGVGAAGSQWSYSAATPIPGAVWLLGTGVVGLFGLRKKFQR